MQPGGKVTYTQNLHVKLHDIGYWHFSLMYQLLVLAIKQRSSYFVEGVLQMAEFTLGGSAALQN